MSKTNQNPEVIETTPAPAVASGELLACPFCAAPAEMIESHRGHFSVQCTNDLCAVRPAPQLSPLAAMTVWNDRPEQKALADMVKLWDDNHPDDKCACLGASEDCKYPPPCELCTARHFLKSGQANADISDGAKK